MKLASEGRYCAHCILCRKTRYRSSEQAVKIVT